MLATHIIIWGLTEVELAHLVEIWSPDVLAVFKTRQAVHSLHQARAVYCAAIFGDLFEYFDCLYQGFDEDMYRWFFNGPKKACIPDRDVHVLQNFKATCQGVWDHL